MGVSDTADMFRYASDPAATRFMNFPRHRAIGDCEAFAGEPAGDSLAYAAIRADPM